MKTIRLLYFALILLAAFSAEASADIVGDANDDNRITTADSVLALQMSVGSITPDIERADVSSDGKVSSLDALMILMMAQKTQVRVNSPDVISGTFDATIDIYNVVDLDSGTFDLSFDSSVVNVTDVRNGGVNDTYIRIDEWNFVDSDTIRVSFKCTGDHAVSGSGHLATIKFVVTGSQGDTSVLDISDGKLAGVAAEEIPALWFDSDVTVGVPVTVNAPEVVLVTLGTFNVTIDIEDVLNLNAGQFDLSFDSSVVNVTDVENGLVNDTMMRINGWTFMDSDTIRVVSSYPLPYDVSGSGYLAVITFAITGSLCDTSVLDISNGTLAGIPSDGMIDTGEIPALWYDSEVAVGVPVTVTAPEVVSGRFDVTIDIENVVDLAAGQFDLSFNSSVVNATDLDDIDDIYNMTGEVGGDEVPVDACTFMDRNSIRLLFNPGIRGAVSGSGSLATIKFEVVGEDGDFSFLNLSNGLLVDKDQEFGKCNAIPAVWINSMVTIENPPDGQTHAVTVYVKNLDDDDLDVYLYIDGNYKKYMSIPPNSSCDYGEYEFEDDEEELHSFKIEWFDPGTGEHYEKIIRSYITSEKAVTLYVDAHT